MIMQMLFRSVVVGVLAVGGIFFIAVLPGTADAGSFVVEECLECHTEGIHTDAKELAEGKCSTCHDAALFASGKTHSQLAKTSPATQSIAEGEGKGHLLPGMSLPMYYDKSRLGAEPNDMILISAGEFIMGTNVRLPDEGPQHTLNLPTFYIDKYEVTNLQYKKYIDDVGRRSPKHFANRTYPDGKADHPVTYVSWKDANAYCEWAGKRLPTDREWEKAARGTDGRTFPWGNEFKMQAANTPVRWEKLGQEGDTAPVGAFEAGVSPYGLYDTSGNVWEWTATWYEAYPGNKRITENYGEKYKTLKGGSWWDCSFYKCGISAPVYNRSFFTKRVKNSSFGFRCARDAALQ